MFSQVVQYWGLTRLFPPTVPGTIDNVRDIQIIDLAIGAIALIYWLVNKPDYALSQKPLGVIFLAAQNALLGVAFVLEGVFLLFVPVLGIIGVGIAGCGLGLCWLSKGLFEGEDWALTVMIVITIIGILAGVAAWLIISPLALGIPVLSLFQLWYLLRPNVSRFFQQESGYSSQSSPMRQELG